MAGAGGWSRAPRGAESRRPGGAVATSWATVGAPAGARADERAAAYLVPGDPCHDPVDEGDEDGDVGDVVAPAGRLDEFPEVAFVPEDDVLVTKYSKKPLMVEMWRFGGPGGASVGEAALRKATRSYPPGAARRQSWYVSSSWAWYFSGRRSWSSARRWRRGRSSG